jgi:hypothetical protein
MRLEYRGADEDEFVLILVMSPMSAEAPQFEKQLG